MWVGGLLSHFPKGKPRTLAHWLPCPSKRAHTEGRRQLLQEGGGEGWAPARR